MNPGKLMRYGFYKLDPAWRVEPPEDRAMQKKEFLHLFQDELALDVHSYSTAARANADFCLWQLGDEPGALEQLQLRIDSTAFGKMLIPSHSLSTMVGRPVYLDGHRLEEPESGHPPGSVRSNYLLVYLLEKGSPLYQLPFTERHRIMGEQLRIGEKYPSFTIHTADSSRVEDQELVLAFESDSLADFLELMGDLLKSRSFQRARDVPIFPCVRTPLEAILDRLDSGSEVPADGG